MKTNSVNWIFIVCCPLMTFIQKIRIAETGHDRQKPLSESAEYLCLLCDRICSRLFANFLKLVKIVNLAILILPAFTRNIT